MQNDSVFVSSRPQCEPAKYRIVSHADMSGQGSVVRKNGFITNLAVMCNMHIGHDPVVITQDGLALTLNRAATDRAEFTNRIAITYSESGPLTRIFLILWIITDRRKLIDVIAIADRCRTTDDDVTVYARTAADFDIITDDRVRPDLHVRGDSSLVRNDCCCVYHLLSPPGAQIIVAEATTSESTLASHRYHHMPRFTLSATT